MYDIFYQPETEVTGYQCDVKNHMKISAAMPQMQQASGQHLESLGFPYEQLLQENMVFLLSKMCIKVHRMPAVQEHIRVGTAPTDTRGARFVREFIIETPKGERLLSAFSLWLLVNPHTRKILRPQSFPHALPCRPSLVGNAIGDTEMPKPFAAAEQLCTEIAIRYSHIDCNNHVNNSVYGDFVCDALPYTELTEKGLDTLILSYHNEAKWGDSLTVTTGKLCGSSYYICGKKQAAPCFEALVQLC